VRHMIDEGSVHLAGGLKPVVLKLQTTASKLECFSPSFSFEARITVLSALRTQEQARDERLHLVGTFSCWGSLV
jgi:hypothetical protein